MALYELRTYTLRVGAMAEAVKLYQEVGFPALHKGQHEKSWSGTSRPIPERSTKFCIFGSSTMMHRRAHWAAVYADKDFVEGFALKLRPLLMTQEVKLLQAAPWGPHP